MDPLRNALFCLLSLLGASCATLPSLWLQDSPDVVAKESSESGVALQRYLTTRDGAADTSGAYRPHIALLPFADESGFRDGIFDLEHEIPRLLIEQMRKQSLWHLVPYPAVLDAVAMAASPARTDDAVGALGELLKADFVGRGRLLDFNLERLQVGDAMLGGYKSFKGTAEMELTLLRVSDHTSETVFARRESTDRGLGLDLLGKPRKQDLQFSGLGSMVFGSEEFLGTGIGQATIQAVAPTLSMV